MFKNLSTEGLEEAQDRLGGFRPLATDIYTGIIKAFYVTTSAGGAMGINLLADMGGREYRETFWVTNKKGENFFKNKDDPTKKVPLPGFTVADDICLITTGKPLSDMDAEDKMINLWDNEAKKELPKSVKMITEVIGQKISLGIVCQLVNKNEKVGDEYVPTAETREENFTDKVFHPEQKLTVAEARAGQEEAKFHASWLERNKDQTRDKRTIKDGEAGAKGAPRAAPTAAGASAAAPRKSLFGNK